MTLDILTLILLGVLIALTAISYLVYRSNVHGTRRGRVVLGTTDASGYYFRASGDQRGIIPVLRPHHRL